MKKELIDGSSQRQKGSQFDILKGDVEGCRQIEFYIHSVDRRAHIYNYCPVLASEYDIILRSKGIGVPSLMACMSALLLFESGLSIHSLFTCFSPKKGNQAEVLAHSQADIYERYYQSQKVRLISARGNMLDLQQFGVGTGHRVSNSNCKLPLWLGSYCLVDAF